MSEHKYLPAEELEAVRKYVSPVARKRFDSVVADLDALRAELKAAQAPLKFAKLERDNRTSVYEVGVKTIGQLREQIYQLTRERDESTSSRDAAWVLINDLRAEIARLRQERASAANEMLDRVRGSLCEYPHGGGDIEVMREVDRIISEATDRMRKALEKAPHARICKKYHCSHDYPTSDYLCSKCQCDCFKSALDPQPAQTEKA